MRLSDFSSVHLTKSWDIKLWLLWSSLWQSFLQQEYSFTLWQFGMLYLVNLVVLIEALCQMCQKITLITVYQSRDPNTEYRKPIYIYVYTNQLYPGKNRMYMIRDFCNLMFMLHTNLAALQIIHIWVNIQDYLQNCRLKFATFIVQQTR